MSSQVIHIPEDAHRKLAAYCKANGIKSAGAFVAGLICNEVRRQREQQRQVFVFQRPDEG